MRAKRRSLLMTIVVALTTAWALTTFVIYVATQDVPAGWVLATILLYAVLFIAMLVLAFTQETPEGSGPLASTTAAAIPRAAAGASTYFATRRGHVDFGRGAQGLADVSVIEGDRTFHMDTVEAALDRIEPTPFERAERAPVPGTSSATTDRPARRPAPAGVPA